MREIIFRGKLINSGKWAYGNLDIKKTGTAIINPDETVIGRYGQVDRNTVGQYTGLHDKNGKEIYEGDIIKAHFKKGAWIYNDKNYYGYKNGKVEYCVDCFILYIENYKEKIYPLSSFGNSNKDIEYLEIIGNIYDNLELLEKGKE